MNHKGEIAYLAGIAGPTVALVTMRSASTWEFHAIGRRGVAARTPAYSRMADDGIAVVIADDAHARFSRQHGNGAWSISAWGGERYRPLCFAPAHQRDRVPSRRAKRRRPLRSRACTTCATRSPLQPLRTRRVPAKAIGEGLTRFVPPPGGCRSSRPVAAPP